MIYTIEKRHVFGGRDSYMETHYEVREYEYRREEGDLPYGKTVKTCKTKAQAERYCRSRGIQPQPRFIAPEEKNDV